MRRALVTGASGFLGAHLCAHLEAMGWTTVPAMRAGSDGWRLARLGVKALPVDLDLTDGEAAMAATLRRHDVDVIVNVAGYGVDYRQQDFRQAALVNSVGVTRLAAAAAAAGVPRFVQIGTAYEYGVAEGAIGEDALLAPKGVYGTTKAAGSLAALAAGEDHALSVTVLRLFPFYGPLENETKLVPMLIGAVAAGRTVPMTPGAQIRDYAHVSDICAAIQAVLEADPAMVAGHALNIGSGAAITLRDFCESVVAAAQNVLSRGGAPVCLWGAKPYRDDELMSLVADTALVRSLVNWQPKITLAQGVRAMIQQDGSLS